MGKWLRRVALALLCSLLAGFAFGTCLRREAERPTLYIGRAEEGARAGHPTLAVADHARGTLVEEVARGSAVEVARAEFAPVVREEPLTSSIASRLASRSLRRKTPPGTWSSAR